MKDEVRHAVLGIFRDPDSILNAARDAGKRGWKHLDAITPYPVHGMEHALGLRQSWVPWVTLVMGFTGGLLGLIFQGWTSAIDWPLNVGGKSFFSWPAFVPVMFECAILIGGICTFIALWMACRLPKTRPCIHDERLTDDRFALIVPLYSGVSEEEIEEFMKGAGADEVRRVEI
ncbi:DUF3341 domain-containing protein [bacterium]|nr:DUF3341 domain-containing protein [bacterium]MBU1982771.1 DUF3341 domain-containing protein [bacterium]